MESMARGAHRSEKTTVDLLGLPPDSLATFLDEIGAGAHQMHRVFRSLHGTYAPLSDHPELGWRNVERIAAHSHRPQMELVRVMPAPDGSEKLLFRLHDESHVEAVLIPGVKSRVTLCLSSQVGCAMGCTFCATGQLGLKRNLEAGEIVAQIHAAIAHTRPQGRRVSHLVFMGMGEPMQNYDAVMNTIRIVTDSRGPCLEARKITVSTVGLVKRMVQFGRSFEGRVQLALSLHAGTDATRQRIIPLAHTYPLAELKRVCQAHPLPGSRHLMIEYVILPGVNDTDAELAGVAQWADGLACVVNLVPFNPFPNAPFRAPTPAETHSVSTRLRALGVMTTVRWPRGRAVNAACGQLALNHATASDALPVIDAQPEAR